jgi:predicted TIM-barrel fold metal-dependent hydrolase
MKATEFISADDHVQEHPDVWSERLSRRKWGDRVPHVKRETDGTDRWYIDSRPVGFNGVSVAAAINRDEPQRWEDVPRAAYVPAERLRAMDADHAAYSVLYPTVAGIAGETFGRLTDPEFEIDCVRAYNDWLIEEWASVSSRFIPLCIVPIYPVEATVAEIERAVSKGHKGVIYPAIPMHLREVPHINEPEYDRVWKCCEELQAPICFHAGSSPHVRLPANDRMSAKLRDSLEAVTRPVSAVFEFSNFLLSRILLRHPRLNVVFAESTAGWGAFLLEYADHQFEQDRCVDYGLKPSERFKRQCFLTSWYDRLASSVNHIGAQNVLWATHFPFPNSTWPNSIEFINRCFQDMSENDRQNVLWDNSARLYRMQALNAKGPERLV